MLENQKDKFKIPDHVSYLNGAYMSPFLKSVESSGHEAVSKKCLPFEITGDDFFNNPTILKKEFSKLVTIDDFQNVAIIPSVSYGIATVTNNIKLLPGAEILVVSEQFPSHIYSWQKLADKYGGTLRVISPPVDFNNRGSQWNQSILEAINTRTAVVAVPHVHWADGTKFDLLAIRQKSKKHDALLIVDGTQSIGAMDFSVKEIQPDALICAGYKWLLGPYALGLAYFGDHFNEGEPIEENWINRKNSEDFTGLVNYEDHYQPGAGRYSVGEMSNFTLTPMLVESIGQLNKWGTHNIQSYCREISFAAIEKLRKMGCFIEDGAYRGYHLFGIYLPENIDLRLLKQEFKKQSIFVSFRGNAIRVSPNVYNSIDDFDKLVKCFELAIE